MFHEYPTCLATYATLRVYPRDLEPDTITRRLGLHPSRTQAPDAERPTRRRAWFLSSRDHVDSRDSRKHIDWLLDTIEPAAFGIRKLMAEGTEADILCYYLSIGHGGPCLDPEQMRRFSEIGLSIGWDIYFDPGPDSDAL